VHRIIRRCRNTIDVSSVHCRALAPSRHVAQPCLLKRANVVAMNGARAWSCAASDPLGLNLDCA
jgi:hypothetical protein